MRGSGGGDRPTWLLIWLGLGLGFGSGFGLGLGLAFRFGLGLGTLSLSLTLALTGQRDCSPVATTSESGSRRGGASRGPGDEALPSAAAAAAVSCAREPSPARRVLVS